MKGNAWAWDRGINHYLYTPGSNDLRFYRDPQKWSLTQEQAAAYVRGHLVKSFEDDHPEVLTLYEASGKHPFMLIRSMMPYLEWVATLYRPSGTDESRVENFINNYFPHKSLVKEFYEIYRNGLMHRHFPKCDLIQQNDNLLLAGWEITSDYQRHLKAEQVKFSIEDDPGTSKEGLLIPICPRRLYEDLLCAMRRYANELEKDNELLKEFLKGFKTKS